MPRAAGFRELVRRLGGSCAEREAGGFVVFNGFQGPYDEGRPVAREELSLATTGGTAARPAGAGSRPGQHLDRRHRHRSRQRPRAAAGPPAPDLRPRAARLPRALSAGRALDGHDRRRGGRPGPVARRDAVGERRAARRQAGPARGHARRPRRGRGASGVPGAGAAARHRGGLRLRARRARAAGGGARRPRPPPTRPCAAATGTRRLGCTQRRCSSNRSAHRCTRPGPACGGVRGAGAGWTSRASTTAGRSSSTCVDSCCGLRSRGGTRSGPARPGSARGTQRRPSTTKRSLRWRITA